jgi:hypothetical protein
VSTRRPIQSHDIEILRRSLTAGQLPAAEMQWVLDEAARLLQERGEIAAAVGRLTSPWSDVRSVLNEISKLVGSGG